MTQHSESKIIKKINYQMWTFVVLITASTLGGLKVAYNWQQGILNAIAATQTDNAVVRSQQISLNSRVDKVELRQDHVEAMIFTQSLTKK